MICLPCRGTKCETCQGAGVLLPRCDVGGRCAPGECSGPCGNVGECDEAAAMVDAIECHECRGTGRIVDHETCIEESNREGRLYPSCDCQHKQVAPRAVVLHPAGAS